MTKTYQTDSRWPARVRSVALTIWATAFLMTGALGWSAWQAYRTASDAADYAAFRQEAGLASYFNFIPAGR
jgi:hypothetical protein